MVTRRCSYVESSCLCEVSASRACWPPPYCAGIWCELRDAGSEIRSTSSVAAVGDILSVLVGVRPQCGDKSLVARTLNRSSPLTYNEIIRMFNSLIPASCPINLSIGNISVLLISTMKPLHVGDNCLDLFQCFELVCSECCVPRRRRQMRGARTLALLKCSVSSRGQAVSHRTLRML